MTVEPTGEPAGFEQLRLRLYLSELRRRQPQTIRQIAGQWTQGLKSLTGLAAAIGVLSASFRVDRLSSSATTTVGLLLATAFSLGATSLLLMMAAAYGTARTYPTPDSLAALAEVEMRSTQTDRSRFLWARRIAVLALAFLAVAIVAAWIAPGSPSTTLTVTTVEGIKFCGSLLSSTDGVIRLGTASSEGYVDLPLAAIEILDTTQACTDR